MTSMPMARRRRGRLVWRNTAVGWSFLLPNFAGFPIAYVSAPESPLGGYHDAIVEFLRDAGCDVDSLQLEEQCVEGNGHAMMLERNNAEALEPVIGWVEDTVGG